MLWGDLEFVIFLSNCTAPIYCNVIKNSYCERLSQFPSPQEFQVTEHPTNSLCLAVVLHSFLYFCWCCLSQSCCPCPPWCPCLWEGQLLRAGGSAQELSWWGRNFSYQCDGRNWSHVHFITRYCTLPSLLKFCPRILWGWCCIPLSFLLRPLWSQKCSLGLSLNKQHLGWAPLELIRNSSQELVLSEELLLCNQQPWKLTLPAWRTPPVEQHFCFRNIKGSYRPGLWSGWKIAVPKPTSLVTL